MRIWLGAIFISPDSQNRGIGHTAQIFNAFYKKKDHAYITKRWILIA